MKKIIFLVCVSIALVFTTFAQSAQQKLQELNLVKKTLGYTPNSPKGETPKSPNWDFFITNHAVKSLGVKFPTVLPRTTENRRFVTTNSPKNLDKITLDSIVLTSDEAKFTNSWTHNSWLNPKSETYYYSPNATTFMRWHADINDYLNISYQEFEASFDGALEKYRSFPEYNAQYLLVYELEEKWENNAWVNNFKWNNEYNTQNLVTKQNCYLWDAGAWMGSWQSEFGYHSNGNINLSITYEWLSGAWSPTYKEEVTYNANNFIISGLSYNWNGTAWVESFKANFEFDANGNTILGEGYAYESGNWVGVYKNTYVFNADNKETQNISYSWEGDAWVNGNKTETTFDVQKNKTLEESYSWDGTSWTFSSTFKWDYTYNSDNLPSLVVMQNNWGDGFNNINKTEFGYDAAKRKILERVFQWEEAWVENAIEEWAYNAQGKLIMYSTKYFWMGWSGEKTDWIYDTYGNCTEKKTSEADGTNWALKNTETFTFNYEIPVSEIMDVSEMFGTVFYPREFTHQITEVKNEEISFVGIEKYFYTKRTQSVTENEKSNIRIYPNPANYELKITNYESTITKVEIYDVTGKKLSTINYPLSTINVSTLSSGIYFVKIYADKQVVTQKFVKQ